MKLYDSKSREKHVFKPIIAGEVSIYVCGITPNNATHLGHAFTYVSFDVLNRVFTSQGLKVKYVQNATDVNDSDDVIRQSQETGQSWRQVAQYWIQHFSTQMNKLNVLPPTQYVLASETIVEIVDLVKKLIDMNYAYEKNGFVYFDVRKFVRYGDLSRYNATQMIAISRDRGNNPDDRNKKNPLDFVLWVPAAEEPMWQSPWGSGRPGWHIECSAMSMKYLGSKIDIHGGGRDLIFPHHESEIAQSESVTDTAPYVQTWMHAGMVMFEGEKMSKSLGNLVLVEDLLKSYSPDTVRFLLLSHHYRHPWEYESGELDEAKSRLQKIMKRSENSENGSMEEVRAYLDNDLDTPALLRYLEEKANGTIINNTLSLLGLSN